MPYPDQHPSGDGYRCRNKTPHGECHERPFGTSCKTRRAQNGLSGIKAVNTVIGMGGISNGTDVVEFLLAVHRRLVGPGFCKPLCVGAGYRGSRAIYG